MRAFTGPFGVFIRSYAFIRRYGPQLREMSEVAVLNANYLLARLKDAYDLPFDRLCMHEFVLSARTLKREHGVSALDVAKRLMDYGFHPPTIYFPLIVPEALMIEPTETEPKERLDEFCDAMLAIAREAATDPDLLHAAPHTRPVTRLDEVKAAKRAVVKYGFEEHPSLPSGRRGVVDRRERERILGEHQPREMTERERREAERLDEDLEDSPLVGKPLPRRLRNFTHSPEAYALAIAGPPAHARRLREIEDLIAGHEEELRRDWEELRRSEPDPEVRARRWREYRRAEELLRGQRPDRAAQPLVPGRVEAADGSAHGRLRQARRAQLPAGAARRRLGARAVPGVRTYASVRGCRFASTHLYG